MVRSSLGRARSSPGSKDFLLGERAEGSRRLRNANKPLPSLSLGQKGLASVQFRTPWWVPARPPFLRSPRWHEQQARRPRLLPTSGSGQALDFGLNTLSRMAAAVTSGQVSQSGLVPRKHCLFQQGPRVQGSGSAEEDLPLGVQAWGETGCHTRHPAPRCVSPPGDSLLCQLPRLQGLHDGCHARRRLQPGGWETFEHTCIC